MPRQVDHDARRAEVAEIAAELIARRGMDGVSLRDVADAAGCSTTVVTHYFTSKRHLLQEAYRSAVAATERRLAAARDGAGDRLLRTCEAILPIDEARRRSWRTWFAFFGAAAADDELAAMQRRRVTQFRGLLAGELAAGGTGSPERAARELMALLHGIASEAVFDPGDWPPERQQSLVRDTLERLRAPAAAPIDHWRRIT